MIPAPITRRATHSAAMVPRQVLILLGWHDERVLRALVRHARDAHWHLETRHFFDETLPEGWSGDGMLVSHPVAEPMLQFMLRQAPRQPTVLLDRNCPAGLAVAAHVHEDNHAAGRLAAQHFLAMGHKHFVWWASETGPVPDERFKGFRESLAAAGCSCQVLRYQSRGPAANEWQRRRDWLGRQLVKLPRPAALFAMDDQLAADVVTMCRERGLDVPGEIAVVGVGNIALASETSPVPITSIDLAAGEIAAAAARTLDHLMRGGRPPAASLVIPPSGLVIRQSSSALAVTHPRLLLAIEHLQQNLAAPFDIDRVSAVAGVSARTLYQLFNSELRCTPVGFLRRQQLAHAKELLAVGARVHTLVDACGFGNARTLNRLFLRHEQCSPKAWQKIHG